ncbi:MAG: hypothetical protein M0R06_02050 [Sphaerochaeta sp.]|jgi:hypothetical protein|nr:hypothetical protein [Sphaerochaeta sp.]
MNKQSNNSNLDNLKKLAEYTAKDYEEAKAKAEAARKASPATVEQVEILTASFENLIEQYNKIANIVDNRHITLLAKLDEAIDAKPTAGKLLVVAFLLVCLPLIGALIAKMF